jgi:HSP20 family protein
MASIRAPMLTAMQPLHTGSRGAAKTLAYRSGSCSDGYSRGASWRGGPFQMNANDMRAAGIAIAQMMDMVRMWQASNPGPRGGGDSNSCPPMQQFLAVDLEEGEQVYTLTADVPGLQKSDLKITVNQKERTLTISGERMRAVKATAEPVIGPEEQDREEPKRQQNRRQRFERIMGAFKRTLSMVPDDADLSAVSARVEKGVLTITVQKMEQKPDEDLVDITID